MAEVVMDDMAIGNPASLWPSFGALGLFPGIHIAQFPFQVIGNCGVISLMRCSNSDKVKDLGKPRWRADEVEVPNR